MTTPSKHTQNIESWATPFRKVLELEVANGYSNKAVVGGLDRFVLHWIEPMAEFLADPNLAKLLVDTPYAELDDEARAGWVYQWQSRLAGEPPVTDGDVAAGAILENSRTRGKAILRAMADPAGDTASLDRGSPPPEPAAPQRKSAPAKAAAAALIIIFMETSLIGDGIPPKECSRANRANRWVKRPAGTPI